MRCQKQGQQYDILPDFYPRLGMVFLGGRSPKSFRRSKNRARRQFPEPRRRQKNH
ncbi:hypothetical protein QT971_30245 [Microcoleus sp. herbarium19]|uniref:hypothetical protein n=1 Tax=unclassified Microcoleus TaxID=2642155 RepID=UPI002FD655C9